jgi:DivIVA domain-containing protein
VDQNSIERIRSATFAISRRGYDKREVDRFLAQVADWLETGAGDPTRSAIVKRELERVGERTAGILASAEESAEQLRYEAETEASQTLQGVRGETERLRREADEYARRQREDADAYAEQTRQEVEQEARRSRLESTQTADEIVNDAERRAQGAAADGMQRRRDLETLITDLLERRDDVLEDLDRLAEELGALVAAHVGEDEGYVEEEGVEAQGTEAEVAAETEPEDLDTEVTEAEPAEAEELEETGEVDEADEAEADEAAGEPTVPLRAERE